ncbi:MAG: hypothetical protein H0W11_13075 [Gemmatimonadetes bacterium]|nr:hypothetical protein [Gemmatimonadota bacterium]
MAMHLFSTPVECNQCGTVVTDPKVDHCPNCNALLKERRTPGRLAGVERRYGNLRFLLGFLRFMGVITAVVGILLFLFGIGDETIPWSVNLLILLGSVVAAVAIFAVAALFDVAMDLEENTRAAFRMQQLLLDEMQQGKRSSTLQDPTRA